MWAFLKYYLDADNNQTIIIFVPNVARIYGWKRESWMKNIKSVYKIIEAH